MIEPSSAVLLFAGIALLVVAFAGWEVNRARQRSHVVANLRSEDPAHRIVTAEALLDRGFPFAAKAVLAAMTTEADPAVRVAVALAVGRRQWEPGTSARAKALRTWARAELVEHGYEVASFGPAFTRLSDMGGPRLPENDAYPRKTSPAPPLRLAAEPGIAAVEGSGAQVEAS